MTKPKITSAQLLLMSVGSALMFPYTFMPILNTPPANQDVWIVLIMAFFYIFIINAPILILINKFRSFNINEMTELIMGKFFGKLAALLFVPFFIFCYTACMLLGSVFISMTILPGTPVKAIIIFSFIGVSFAAYKGAGTIGRLAAFLVPFVMFTVIFFFLLGLDLMHISVLKPVLADSTFLKLNQGAFLTASRYSEILIFLVFSFFMPKKENLNKTYIRALGTFGLFYFMILIPTILVLGVDLAKLEFNPYFVFTRQVRAYDFIQRVQSINTLAWYPGLMLKLTIYCFMASFTLSGIFNAKSHKPFVIPVTLMSLCVCMIPAMQKSSVIMLLASDKVFPYVILPFTFVLPSVILLVYLFRRKKINAILDQKRAKAEKAEKAALSEAE